MKDILKRPCDIPYCIDGKCSYRYMCDIIITTHMSCILCQSIHIFFLKSLKIYFTLQSWYWLSTIGHVLQPQKTDVQGVEEEAQGCRTDWLHWSVPSSRCWPYVSGKVQLLTTCKGEVGPFIQISIIMHSAIWIQSPWNCRQLTLCWLTFYKWQQVGPCLLSIQAILLWHLIVSLKSVSSFPSGTWGRRSEVKLWCRTWWSQFCFWRTEKSIMHWNNRWWNFRGQSFRPYWQELSMLS
jgi:hypothetical protein